MKLIYVLFHTKTLLEGFWEGAWMGAKSTELYNVEFPFYLFIIIF